MSGPGLTQHDAHHAIHQAAFHEAEQLTLLLRQALRVGDQQRALQVAAVLIEHWQARTLRHAEAEETGWYRDLLAERPALQNDVIALTRDHDLLRILLAEIQGIIAARGVASGIVERFEAMLLLNAIHSRTEEQRLLGEVGAEEASDVADDSPGAAPARAVAGSDLQSDTPPRTAGATPVPLAIGRPDLYERLSALLRERGVNPADILAELQGDVAGQAILSVAFGHEYQQTMEWPLPYERADAPGDASSDTSSTALAAEEAILRTIAESCAQATQADYHARMRTPT